MDYLYYKNVEKLNWKKANKFFKERYKADLGGCTSVRKGMIFGRNYDWYYSNTVYFLTRVKAKYNSISICGGFADVTKESIDSGNKSGFDYYIPFLALDGINESHVCCSMNVVPTDDMGRTTGTVPLIEKREELCQIQLVRYILDNFGSAKSAVEYIQNYISVYAPNTEHGNQEIHLMVCDENDTYLIEFIENETVITNMESELPDRMYMTNFFIFDTEVYSNGHINYSTVTDYGSGLERYDLIADSIDDVNTTDDMVCLMKTLWFTNAYQPDILWYTEFVGGELKISSPPADFMSIIEAARAEYLIKERNSKLWQTCHTSVYNINKGLLTLITQEDDSELITIAVNPNEGGNDMAILEELHEITKNFDEDAEMGDNIAEEVNNLNAAIGESAPPSVEIANARESVSGTDYENLKSRLDAEYTELSEGTEDVNDAIGSLTSLKTTAKTDLVSAINEIFDMLSEQ